MNQLIFEIVKLCLFPVSNNFPKKTVIFIYPYLTIHKIRTGEKVDNKNKIIVQKLHFV